ncbi:HemN-related non-iron pseudo-SAM protein PsgB [Candidatus Borreliella tachyglossi]|uniref:HemN-related non-iron pseudo-SAM protein PsgB n=1 Tax=Candidatus Borreliella tachyglossi TaxID=1964448 RepID=A0A2S1LY49_9SPIR|nr:HemN-related non-iron pseudo-SAM protein PsgB [Candidatus Borreliella tachyglossi]
MNFLPLSDLSIYIDITNCFKYSFLNKILSELNCYLEALSYPKIRTLYIKHQKDLSFINEANLESFLASLSESIDLVQLSEFTFEVYSRGVTPSFLRILNNFSVSRISLNIKSFSQKFLGIMGASRVSFKKVNAVIDNIRRFNFDLNIDLNIQIPYQEKMELKRDLVRLVGFVPEHICLSEISIDEKNFIKNLFGDTSCEDEDQAEDFWFYALDFLESSGYINYEISNFALKGHESKHNLRYWRLEPYLGLGMNSVSLLIGTCGNEFTALIRKDDNFLESEKSSATFEMISNLDFFIFHFMTNLGTRDGLSISVLERRFRYNREDFVKFIDYLLSLNKEVIFSNNILYLNGYERFKLDFYLHLIREYLLSNSFKVNFKFL